MQAVATGRGGHGRRGLAAGLSALTLAAFAAAIPAMLAIAQPAAKVGVDLVRSQAVSQTFPVIGRLVARRAGVVAARVEGPVEEMRVEVGDHVKQGQVIAVLVRERLRWERELRQADLAEALAQLESARSEMNRVAQEVSRLERLKQNRSAAFQQALYDDKQLEVTMLKSRIAEAEARVARTRANLSLARIDFEDAEIRAPYGGVVTLRHTEAGAYLKVGDDVVTLVADGELEIEADVPAERVAGLAPGTEVTVRVAGEHRGASVRAVVPDENPLTRTRAVRLTPGFEVQGRDYAANQSVTVEIPIGAMAEAVTVHKDAILHRQGTTLVFVVADGAARPTPVKLGDAVGDRFVVLDGLAPDDIVVVRGNERLRPGQAVSY